MLRSNLVNIAVIVLLVTYAVSGEMFDAPYNITLATKVAILGMAGAGLNLALGYCGLISFGHAAFFGLGGYIAGILAVHAFNHQPIFLGWSGTNQMIAIWVFALLATGLLALLIGLLSLRTSGVYFIMITLAFAQMLYYFAISWPSYGGEDGLSTYLRNGFPGLNTMDGMSFFTVCLAWLVFVLWLSSRIINSRFGLAMQAVRENPVRLAGLGVSPFRVKLTVFVLSGMITGIAGALYTDLNRFVSPSVLSWHMSGEIMILVIIGGVATLSGPVAGAMLFIFLEQWLGGLTEFWQFWLGLMLLLVVLFAGGGIIGTLNRWRAS
jgi:branched-chain amino acid transport system permease protein